MQDYQTGERMPEQLKAQDKKTITFHVRELADCYALKILHDYLTNQGLENDMYFIFSRKFNRQAANGIAREILEHLVTTEVSNGNTLSISTLCDLKPIETDLQIDLSLLKNCAFPLTAEEKAGLRKKYQIDSSKPIIVA